MKSKSYSFEQRKKKKFETMTQAERETNCLICLRFLEGTVLKSKHSCRSCNITIVPPIIALHILFTRNHYVTDFLFSIHTPHIHILQPENNQQYISMCRFLSMQNETQKYLNVHIYTLYPRRLSVMAWFYLNKDLMMYIGDDMLEKKNWNES